MMRYCLLLLVVVAASCKKSDPSASVIVEESKVFISNEKTSGGGIITTFKNPGSVYTAEAYTLTVNKIPEVVADMQIYNDRLYMIRELSSIIEIANVSDLKPVKKIEYAKPIANNINKHLVVVNDKAIVADRDYIPGTNRDHYNSFLKVVAISGTKVDSVSVVQDKPITALTAGNGKIFAAAGSNPQFIYVFDINSYAQVAKFSFGGFCTDLLLDKNNNLLAFGGGFLRRYEGTNFSMTKEKQIGGTQLNFLNDATTAQTAYTLDRDNNILYFLSTAPQPASAPYLINSYNLETDALTLLSNKFFSGLTLAFHKGTGQIIVGDIDGKTGTGIVRFYSTTAELKSEISIPGPPNVIVVN